MQHCFLRQNLLICLWMMSRWECMCIHVDKIRCVLRCLWCCVCVWRFSLYISNANLGLHFSLAFNLCLLSLFYNFCKTILVKVAPITCFSYHSWSLIVRKSNGFRNISQMHMTAVKFEIKYCLLNCKVFKQEIISKILAANYANVSKERRTNFSTHAESNYI